MRTLLFFIERYSHKFLEENAFRNSVVLFNEQG